MCCSTLPLREHAKVLNKERVFLSVSNFAVSGSFQLQWLWQCNHLVLRGPEICRFVYSEWVKVNVALRVTDIQSCSQWPRARTKAGWPLLGQYSKYSANWDYVFMIALLRSWLYALGQVRVGAFGWGTALQAGRSWVRCPMESLEFLSDFIPPVSNDLRVARVLQGTPRLCLLLLLLLLLLSLRSHCGPGVD